MTFPRYPAYKDSGVEWLGKVPGHWDVASLKRIATCNDQVLPENTPEDFEIEYVEISDVDASQGITNSTTQPFGNAPSRARRRVRHGDAIVSTVRTYLRAIAPVVHPPENMIVSTGFAVVRPSEERLIPGFLGYAMRAEGFIGEVIARSVGVSYPAINASDLMSLAVAVPPRLDQTAIATFLDHETSKIDALIAEQKNLIALLKEKRQAVISHAVTKGLNPDAPMKDSGVEWLGEVPEHWQLIPVWLLFDIGRGRVISHQEIMDNSGEYPVYSSQTENDGVMGHLATYDFEGDYLTWTTDGANAGTVFRRSGRFNCTNVCGTLKPRDNNIFLDYFWLMLSISTRSFVRQDINPKLMNNVMAGIRVLVPPRDEQMAIATLLTRAFEGIDALTREAESTIEVLQERRSALISAAVTGKIDVRGLVPKEAA